MQVPEKAETRLRFDPKRDITRDDLAHLDEKLKTLRGVTTPVSLGRFGASFSLITGKPVHLSTPEIDGMRHHAATKTTIENNLRALVDMKMLLPDSKLLTDNDISMVRERWEELRGMLTSLSPSVFLECTANAKILFPRESFPIQKGEWKLCLEMLDRMRKANGWFSFATIASHMRIANSNGARELQITDSDWSHMRDELKSYRAGDWTSFCHLAYFMTILAAEKLEVTTRGLEVSRLNSSRDKDVEMPGALEL
jgi:hypothetical protein